jgi:mono/diheme cytochrome c family protein
VFSLAALSVSSANAGALETQLQRGKYLVSFSTCSNCHTPGSLLGHPDLTRLLAGSDVGYAIPGLGIFVPPNLTPDKTTGLGSWTFVNVVLPADVYSSLPKAGGAPAGSAK